ncbi:MAG: bifunctional methylenetetrahydrofolate dehydrogenase/methenyltetrahydrofolate cyclohydrolase FolD [Eubacteriales bacterium]|nr:bifunctional methylenetetrahydrofolate dehydrogenase/methenyltetrahydrofolate cyclohydrolase FolD [Eubacteriales bacterium]
MALNIIDGKAISNSIRQELKVKAADLKKKGVVPGLAVVLVGDDPASATYVRNKERACEEIGIYSVVHRLGVNTAMAQLVLLIHKMNDDPALHGILIQLPLPGHLDEREVLREVDPDKDVDGLHVVTAGRLFVGEKGFIPCTPKGIIHMIKSTGVGICGKNAVVVGRSNMVGKPISMLLMRENATVTMCHSRTNELARICAGADILVAATGRPGMITGEYIKPGAVVIDVGTTKVDGKLRGDVLFDEAKEIAAYISPVPGGVGPMTITMLLDNTIEAANLYG